MRQLLYKSIEVRILALLLLLLMGYLVIAYLIYVPWEYDGTTPAGTYPLFMGMYDPDTAERLDVYDACAELKGDFFELTKITIEPIK